MIKFFKNYSFNWNCVKTSNNLRRIDIFINTLPLFKSSLKFPRKKFYLLFYPT